MGEMPNVRKDQTELRAKMIAEFPERCVAADEGGNLCGYLDDGVELGLVRNRMGFITDAETVDQAKERAEVAKKFCKIGRKVTSGMTDCGFGVS